MSSVAALISNEEVSLVLGSAQANVCIYGILACWTDALL